MSARSDLHQIVHAAGRLLDNWAAFESTAGDLIATDTHKLGVHGGDIPDPTYAAQFSTEDLDEVVERIAHALADLHRAENTVNPIAAEHPETAREVEAATRGARCSDATCHDLEVKHGYCTIHWWTHRLTCTACQLGETA